MKATKTNSRPSRSEAENAVRVLISWIGDSPYRQGLIKTPERLLDYYSEIFAGYKIDDPIGFLGDVPYDIKNLDNNMIVLRDIDFKSCCEHHMLPIIGKVKVAYIPDGKIAGISKIARLVDAYAKRLQLQERLTTQIAKAIDDAFNPKGVAVSIVATHYCMSYRGVCKKDANMKTTHMIGIYCKDLAIRQEFLSL